MLTITIPAVEADEAFDERTGKFVQIDAKPAFVLQLEHSLVSLSKWESIWKKPFLSDDKKTVEETLGYIKIMTLTPNVPPEVYDRLSEENIAEVNQYMTDSMTATWFRETKTDGKKEIITAELIYYWMIALQIDWQAQHWHLNQLLTLVRVCNEKNAPEKAGPKRTAAEIAAARRELNKQRQQQYKTTG